MEVITKFGLDIWYEVRLSHETAERKKNVLFDMEKRLGLRENVKYSALTFLTKALF